MNDVNVFSYGAIPRKCDRGKAYLYFKRWAGRLFKFEGARKEDDVVRVVLLASLSNGYVEGSANLLGVVRSDRPEPSEIPGSIRLLTG